MPQFLGAGSGPLLPAAMILAMAAIVFGGLTGYAHLAARLSRMLARRGTARAINGTVGAVLVTVGAQLALAHR